MTQQRRKKGTGSLFQHVDPTNGRIRWKFEMDMPDGSGKVTGTGDTAEEAVLRQARNRERRLAAQGQTTPLQRAPKAEPRKPRKRSPRANPKSTWYVSEYLEWWSNSRNVQEYTRRKDYRMLEMYVLDTLGHLTLKELTTGKIRNWWRGVELDNPDKPGLKRNLFKVMNTALNKAVKEEVIKPNPMFVLDKPRISDVGIEPETMLIMIDKTRALNGWLSRMNPKTDIRYYDEECGKAYWVRLCLAMHGLRPSEALGLTWDAVHLGEDRKKRPDRIEVKQVLSRKDGALCIKDSTKTGKNRLVVLRKFLVTLLREWMREQRKMARSEEWKPLEGLENLVITRPDGRPYNQNEDQQMFQDLLVKQQMRITDESKRLIFPVGKLRHVAATMNLDAGLDPLQVANAWGHSLETQQRYYYSPILKAQVRELTKNDGLFGIEGADKDETVRRMDE